MVTKRPVFQRMTLLLAAAAWLLALGYGPVMSIHVLSEHMCSEEAQSVSDEHDDHGDDHGHPTPHTLLGRRPSPNSSVGASLALPCVPALASLFAAEDFRVVAQDVTRFLIDLHLARSPVLRI